MLSRCRFICVLFWIVGFVSSSGFAQSTLSNVVNPGTTAWANAARTGRADTLILGDSVVAVGAHGWDQGLNLAGSNDFGLAGTGLYGAAAGSYGYGFANYGAVANTDNSISAVPSAQQGYALINTSPITAGATPVTSYGFDISGETLKTDAAYDWHLYSASPTGGGSISAFRRIGAATPNYFYNTLQTVGPVATQSPAAGGLQETIFHFDPAATPADPSVQQEFWFQNMTNTSVLYSRLLQPGATGITVSSIGYGEHDTRQMYQDMLAPMSAPGRASYFNSLVEGGSGKLNVVITEGFNDRNDTAPSINNVAVSKTPQGFADNLSTLIQSVRGDWAAAGLAPNNLSFTLVGMYRDFFESDQAIGTGPLYQYAGVEMAMAKADPRISFVDLYDNEPDYNTANALGYMQDTTHPSWLGAATYSQYIMDTIAAPEPTSLGLLAMASMMMLKRRTRRS